MYKQTQFLSKLGAFQPPIITCLHPGIFVCLHLCVFVFVFVFVCVCVRVRVRVRVRVHGANGSVPSSQCTKELRSSASTTLHKTYSFLISLHPYYILILLITSYVANVSEEKYTFHSDS